MISAACLTKGSTSDEAARYMLNGFGIDIRTSITTIADVFLSTAEGKRITPSFRSRTRSTAPLAYIPIGWSTK